MIEHKVGTREEWLAAREELLAQEKVMMGFYGLLDRAPKGRDEGDPPDLWIRRHDEY
jgi:predicted dithiol-disulfide oxidoreductase (DUF899 family)